MKLIRYLLPSISLALLGACASLPQNLPLADPQATQTGRTLPGHPELATVYISRLIEGGHSYFNAKVDGKQVAQLKDMQFTQILAKPGLYTFDVAEFSPKSSAYNRPVSSFELGLEAGAVAYVMCGWNTKWKNDDRYLMRPQQCGAGKQWGAVTRNGVTFCAQPKPDFDTSINLAGVVYSDAEKRNCRLVSSPQRYTRLNNQMKLDQVLAGVELLETQRTATSSSSAETMASTSSEATTASRARFEALQQQQACKLTNNNWAYSGRNCKHDLAHGEGTAQDRQGLEFIGAFVAGERVSGEIHQDGEMIFSGKLVNDKPEGDAICLYEGAYEECRFYKGERIDSLYKIRKENAKLRREMVRSQPSYSTSGQNSATDHAVDALKKEATKQATSFIFDKLF